jgi:hypothetical protein
MNHLQRLVPLERSRQYIESAVRGDAVGRVMYRYPTTLRGPDRVVPALA